MKVLIDTNVALDILLQCQPWYTNAALVFSFAQQNYIECYISASAITDIFYVAKKDLGKSGARAAMKILLQVFRPATVTDSHIYKALETEWDDFEDSVQFIVGERLSVDYIVTRNAQDFLSGDIPAVTPERFIQLNADIEQ
jgi:predicted nucleic acid-binding protein